MLKRNHSLTLAQATATIKQGEHSFMTENDPKIEKAQDKPAEKPASPDPEAKKTDGTGPTPVTDKAASVPAAKAAEPKVSEVEDTKPESEQPPAKSAAPSSSGDAQKAAPAEKETAEKIKASRRRNYSSSNPFWGH